MAVLLVVPAVIGLAKRQVVWAGVVALSVAGLTSGVMSIDREVATLLATAPSGRYEVVGQVLEDPRPGATGTWFTIRPRSLGKGITAIKWEGPPLLVTHPGDVELAVGQIVRVDGVLRPGSGWARGDPYAARVIAREITRVADAEGLLGAANLIRDRVGEGLASLEDRSAAALLSGFLIGDVRELPPDDGEALRRAGLSHFVAVSGSNVSLFLILWWVIVGPLGIGRMRAVTGISGLALFVVVTRWEPSVLRASVMAGSILVARAAGWSIGPWSALGAGVTVLLLVSGDLVSDIGFQLSVAATAGVIAGATYRPLANLPMVGKALAATVAAQVAVAPLLLVHFGTVPLLSPVTNILAVPLVLAATSFGGVGVLLGLGPLVGTAGWAARLVLAIARAASPWPQLGAWGVAAIAAGALLARLQAVRRPLAVGLAALLFVQIGLGPRLLDRPAVVFLDVGQGDATLLLGDDGAVVLVDGGPNPLRLLSALQRYGIGHVDLLVASHPHSDHVAGLISVVAALPVGLLWHSGYSDPGDEMQELLSQADAAGVEIGIPEPGWTVRIGRFHIEILGPKRRYSSPNDQSIVLRIRIEDEVILLPGDVETFAQKDLGVIEADILKVPHQGAATSDLDWLRATGARLAVIPVGPNDYGHPSEKVVAALRGIGSKVVRTDEAGDVVVSVGR